MPDPVLSILKEIIAGELNLPVSAESIDERTLLINRGLALDSVAVVDLIARIETRFGIVFKDSELTPEQFASVGALATLLRKKQFAS